MASEGRKSKVELPTANAEGRNSKVEIPKSEGRKSKVEIPKSEGRKSKVEFPNLKVEGRKSKVEINMGETDDPNGILANPEVEEPGGFSFLSRKSTYKKPLVLSVHELEPIESLYLDRHQKMAIAALGMGSLLLATSSLFLSDWGGRQRDCHLHEFNYDPPVIDWGWVHGCRLSVELDQWMIAGGIGVGMGVIQFFSLALAVYAQWDYWCKLHMLCFVAGILGVLLGITSKLYLFELDQPALVWQIRAAAFYGMLVLDTIFLPFAFGLVYFWTLFYKCL